MPNFIKGTFAQYQELMELRPEYAESLYLATDEHRLYENGAPLDVRIEVHDVIDEDYLHKVSYVFTGPDGEVATIADSVIPPVEDYLFQLHDVSTGIESVYHNGLMSFRDKFVLDSIAKLLGITVEYKYWATVHHYSDVLNNRPDILTEVEVHQRLLDGGEVEWFYEYDDFIWDFYNTGTETVYIRPTVPAGTINLTDNGVYELPDHVVVEGGGTLPVSGDPIVIPGVNEVETVRAMSMKFVRKAKDFNFYDGGGRSEDTSTLFPVGAMPVGVTVEELEKETVSEVVSRILFPEDPHYVKICDTSAYIKFTDEYMERYGDGKEHIYIGSKYPSVDELETVFIPETWQLVAADQSIGEPVYKTQWVSTDYFIDDGQHLGMSPHGDDDPPKTYPVDDDPNSEYNKHLTMFTVGSKPHYCDGHLDHTTWSEVDRSVYFGIVHYQYLDPSIVDASMMTMNHIGFEGLHSTHPNYVGTDTDFRNSLVAGWPILTNATTVDTSSCWNIRNVEPGEYVGEHEVKAWCFGVPDTPIYLRWPSDTAPDEHFYIYLPETYFIKEIGGAHDGANDEWSALQGAAKDIDEETGLPVVVDIDYRAFGVEDVDVTHPFNRWVVDKAACITNIRVVIDEVSTNEG